MSRQILHIDASANGAESDSRQLSSAFVARWLQSHPQDHVTHRDVDAQPLPHFDQRALSAVMTAAEQRSPAQVAAAGRVDQMIEEFLAADVIVLGVPMYNFSVPSTLKAWLDHIAIAGRTFRYSENGPVGLAGGRQVIVLSTRGGVYGEGPHDHQVSYLRTFFGLLGIDDVKVIQAEGLSMDGQREPALSAAHAAIDASFAGLPVAA